MEGFAEEEEDDDCVSTCDLGFVNEMELLSKEDVNVEADLEDATTEENNSKRRDQPIDVQREKHISIVQHFKELVDLTNITEAGPKCCPLCRQEKIRRSSSDKLLRHLKYLHWEISVEYEGYRMCICNLKCLPAKPNMNEDQFTAKTGGHYHCILCPAMILRRAVMIRHMKQHMNKGEKQIQFITGSPVRSSEEILREADTNVQVIPNYTTPMKTDSFFNPKMKTNRQLIFCALAVLAQERSTLECLDAFGSTGIMGLQWAKNLGSSVKVTINDINEKSVEMIRENCQLNRMKVTTCKDYDYNCDETVDGVEKYLGSVEVTRLDANVLMHLRAFDFIHLDPFGTTVNFLDAAFRNVRNLGIVSLTSTDVSSLYGKALHVAKRHYGVNIVRTEYFRELAVRVVVSAVARAAARCNKGIDVLLSVAVDHFILVVVRVLRGPTEADDSANKIRTLIHCQWCEERIFQKEGHMVGDNPYQQLPCNCHEGMPGKSAIELGPMWSGTIFNTDFLRRMRCESVKHRIEDIQPLLKTLICESECTTHKQLSVALSQYNKEETGVVIRVPALDVAGAQTEVQHGKKRHNEMDRKGAKRQRSEARLEQPCFYYSIHRHSIRGMNTPKLNKFMDYLTQAGYLVSRTHFDPLGVRTNATLAKFKSILEKHSSTTHTDTGGATSMCDLLPAEEVPLVVHNDLSDSTDFTEIPLSHVQTF
ncbi:TRMT1-like protein isoform X2 [Ambystoma mexicanum]|uniref:TRMT1-like protein isoform X2 n=1 Tax=Ambystoma mexicanum TaxID=8296 RepID=UPI0037E96A51